MASVYCTGPAFIFVGTASLTGKQPELLGTAETKPDIRINAEWDQVFNDIAGSKISFDDLFEGEWGVVGALLTRFNENVLAKCMSRPNYANGVRGTGDQLSRGTLMAHEDFTYPLWVKFPYAPANAGGKAAMAGMPAGYRFWNVKLKSPDSIESGTRAMKINVVFECKPAFTAASSPLGAPAIPPIGGGTPAWVLYDHDMTGLPQID